MSPPLGVVIFRQSASDLIEDQADQRLGARDVGWRHYEVERRWSRSADDVGDAPIAAARHLCDNGIAIEARSEEHTSELQVTNAHLVCRLLLEKKKKKQKQHTK